MTTPALPICPQCKQTNQVQKVSSIYELNTKEWIETKSYHDADGDTHYSDEKHQAHTLLGLKLKPPEKPSAPTHPGIWYGLGILGILFLLSFCCPFTIFPILVVAGIVNEPPLEIHDIAGMPSWMLLAVAGLCLLLLVVAVLVWVGILVKRRYDRAIAEYRANKEAYEQEQLPSYQRARERWERLYYCLRDDIVFIPAENKAVPAEDMTKYLYDSYYMY